MNFNKTEREFIKYDRQSKPYIINSIKNKKRFTKIQFGKIKNNRFTFTDFTFPF